MSVIHSVSQKNTGKKSKHELISVTSKRIKLGMSLPVPPTWQPEVWRGIFATAQSWDRLGFDNETFPGRTSYGSRESKGIVQSHSR
jgi:hypothetical protein